MPQSAEYYFMILFARARKKEKESPPSHQHHTSSVTWPLRTATTIPSRSGHHHLSATLSMEPEEGLAYTPLANSKTAPKLEQ